MYKSDYDMNNTFQLPSMSYNEKINKQQYFCELIFRIASYSCILYISKIWGVIWPPWPPCWLRPCSGNVIGIHSIYPFQTKSEILTISNGELTKNLKIVNI